MSIVLISEPIRQGCSTARDLHLGTWFLNQLGQISLVLLDERSLERRVIQIGKTNYPAIVKDSARDVSIGKLLIPGSVFQIIQPGFMSK